MNKNAIISLAALIGVIAFALLWNTLTGAASAIFAALTFVCAAAFVWAVQSLIAPQHSAPSAPERTDHSTHSRAA